MSNADDYRSARGACELARMLLDQHDFGALLDDIARADSIGAIVDPTLYRSKAKAMLEDREVFRAAKRFVDIFPARPVEGGDE